MHMIGTCWVGMDRLSSISYAILDGYERVTDASIKYSRLNMCG